MNKTHNSLEIKVAQHYAEAYFNNFQKEIGQFGGLANKFMFEKHIRPEDVVLDFGCGGGFLLSHLTCEEKIGVELNPVAREYCINVNGIKCFESLDLLPDESVDVVISSHCLEHTINPFEIVSFLYDKLKRGGKIIIVVPLESYSSNWVSGNIDNHLYSFSPMNLGNILLGASFTNIEVMPVHHKWIPKYRIIADTFGLQAFHTLSWIYGWISRNKGAQIKGIGIKQYR